MRLGYEAISSLVPDVYFGKLKMLGEQCIESRYSLEIDFDDKILWDMHLPIR